MVLVMNTGKNTAGNRTERIGIRRGIIGCGVGFTVALDDKGCIRYTGENRWGQAAVTAWQGMLAVFCGPDYILGLCQDGTVLGEGRNDFHQLEVESLACVTTLSCGEKHVAALIGNGRVMCVGNNDHGQSDTHLWRDMVDVACGKSFTVGLCRDGRVVMAGGHQAMAQAISEWKDVAGLFVDERGKNVLAITGAEGRLLSTARLPSQTKKWRHLVYVAASAGGVVGVTAHGRLLCTNAAYAKAFLRETREYVACAIGQNHVSVLCKTGEVLSVGHNEFGQSATARWGKIFTSFELYLNMRREAFLKKERTERSYQKSLSEATRHARRLSCGERLTACIQADGHVSATAGLQGVKKWRNVCALSLGSAHILALHKDGRVSADGNNVGGCCQVDHWSCGRAVLAGKYHSLCLQEDGHVLFAGWNIHGQGDVEKWQHIQLLRGTDTYTVGVDTHGKIYTAGKNLPFDPMALTGEEWRDLVDIQVSEHHIVGLRVDGRVVALGDEDCYVGATQDQHEMCHVSLWRGVRAIAVGNGFTVGLCYGGRVLAAGRNDMGQCHTDAWQHAVYVGCGHSYTAALLADGRVVTTGQHQSGLGGKTIPGVAGGAVMAWEKAESTGYEPFHTEYMSDILALYAGPEHLVAVDRHGQVMAEGLDLDGQCTSASGFVLFRDIRQLDGFGVFQAASASASTQTVAHHTHAGEMCGTPSTTSHHLHKKRKAEGIGEQGIPCLPWGTVMLSLRAYAQNYLSLIDLEDDRMAVQTANGGVMVFDFETGVLVEESGDACEIISARQREDICPSFNGPAHWENTVSLAVSNEYAVALFEDGHVEAIGENGMPVSEVESWSRMVMIHTVPGTIVGLCADGRVLWAGKRAGVLPLYEAVFAMAVRGDRQIYLLADGSLQMCVGEQEVPTPLPKQLKVFDDDGQHHILQRLQRVYTSEDLLRKLSVTVGQGLAHTAYIEDHQRVMACGQNTAAYSDVNSWSDGDMVACGTSHTVAVLHNGTIVATGRNTEGQCEVSAWNDPKTTWRHISCCFHTTVAVDEQGHVKLTGKGYGAEADKAMIEWQNVDMVACGISHIVALTTDGKALSTGQNDMGQCSVNEWQELVMLSVGERHTVGLTASGHVVATGDNTMGQCRVDDLTDVVSVACLPEATLCVCRNGHVVVRGGTEELVQRVQNLRNIVMLYTHEYRVSAMTSGGRLIRVI